MGVQPSGDPPTGSRAKFRTIGVGTNAAARRGKAQNGGSEQAWRSMVGIAARRPAVRPPVVGTRIDGTGAALMLPPERRGECREMPQGCPRANRGRAGVVRSGSSAAGRNVRLRNPKNAAGGSAEARKRFPRDSVGYEVFEGRSPRRFEDRIVRIPPADRQAARSSMKGLGWANGPGVGYLPAGAADAAENGPFKKASSRT